MNIALFLREIPVWVWLLLVFLLHRGCTALYDRKISSRRLFFLPVLFLIWGTYGVITETKLAVVSLTMMTVGLLAGAAIGYRLWSSQPPLRSTENPDIIIRAGTPLNLGLIVITFCIKFILASVLYLQPGLRSHIIFCILFGGMTGLVDGVFWGGTLKLFIPWYSKNS